MSDHQPMHLPDGRTGGALVPLETAVAPIEVDEKETRSLGISIPLAAGSELLQAAVTAAPSVAGAAGKTFRPVANAAFDTLRGGGKLMQGDVGVFGDVVVDGQVAGKLQFAEVGSSAKGAAAAMGALQVVSFAVGQYHLHEINQSLGALESGLDSLDKRHDDGERARLGAAATLLQDVVAQQRAGNSIESDREQLAAARRDVDEVLDASLARAERLAAPATKAAALAAHIASSKDQATRAAGLREQREMLESIVERFDPEHQGPVGALAERLRIDRLLDRVRDSAGDEHGPSNEFSKEIDQLAATAAELAARLSEVDERERKGAGDSPDAGELARLLDELGDSAPRLVSALEIVAEASQLSCLLAVMAAFAEADEGRQSVALGLSADHLRVVGERLRSVTSALPSMIEMEAFHTHLKRRHRWTSSGAEHWAPVGNAAIAGGAIGELLEAAAADDLLLRVGEQGQLELCRRQSV